MFLMGFGARTLELQPSGSPEISSSTSRDIPISTARSRMILCKSLYRVTVPINLGRAVIAFTARQTANSGAGPRHHRGGSYPMRPRFARPLTKVLLVRGQEATGLPDDGGISAVDASGTVLWGATFALMSTAFTGAFAPRGELPPSVAATRRISRTLTRIELSEVRKNFFRGVLHHYLPFLSLGCVRRREGQVREPETASSS